MPEFVKLIEGRYLRKGKIAVSLAKAEALEYRRPNGMEEREQWMS